MISKPQEKLNLALLCDFYELTMSNGYFKSALKDTICHFDVFFRKIPDNGSFVIAAGLEQVIDYIQNLHFGEKDIAYLRSQGLFDEEFLHFLKEFRFSGDITAVREGEIVFPYEPLLSVRARAAEAQILETFLLLTLNHQSLIATKANRIANAAKGRKILEFGSRRAQGIDAALNGARAAFIGGSSASACTLAGKEFGIEVAGTMAHSWVQMFENEFEAFKTYCELYPQNAVLLVDTYDTLKGVDNAIKAFKAVFKDANGANLGVRLDSGDLVTLTKEARKKLDKANLKHCKIVVSGALDEFEIKNLLDKSAPIDAFGVGEKLITAKSSPVLGCVYKLVATEENGILKPKIKISENDEKITIPSIKKLYRFFDKISGKALFDKLCLQDEEVGEYENLRAEPLQVEIFKNGKLVYEKPNLEQIKAYSQHSLARFDESFLSLETQKNYELVLSQNLQALKNLLLQEQR